MGHVTEHCHLSCLKEGKKVWGTSYPQHHCIWVWHWSLPHHLDSSQKALGYREPLTATTVCLYLNTLHTPQYILQQTMGLKGSLASLEIWRNWMADKYVFSVLCFSFRSARWHTKWQSTDSTAGTAFHPANCLQKDIKLLAASVCPFLHKRKFCGTFTLSYKLNCTICIYSEVESMHRANSI